MYLDTYNFSARPFQLTPDLRFLFPSRSHKRALSYLRFGLEQAEGFVVITGHIGTGKTMLIQTLLAEMADQDIATARIAAANLTEDNILAAVAAALNQPYEGKSKVALMANMEKSLRHARDRLAGVMLIVDEAQTLTPEALEELRILSNLESQGRALMQIFLVGQTELRVTLQSRRMEQLRQRIVASYHLEPMSPEETKRYIGFRLVAVGWNGDPSFAPEVYEQIFKSTGGIPRKVNIVMDRLLLFGYLEDIRDFDGEHIEQVIGEMRQELSGDLVTTIDEQPVDSEGQPVSRVELEERLRLLESKLDELVGTAGTG
ncbi:MAG: AAA family ATPase [Gammaproteobacteria bacterium]|nr:AAA family ATPase [Gammaproteobacteria bacterium]NNF59893.1 AAA family ATPase [Gammaproteobacteria bacterium]NNM21627.1 AAA family ATPase [Gammaproteobacteria bacterium]